jgi:hypothetical protein
MNQTEKTLVVSTNKWRVIGKVVFGAVSIVLVVALLVFSLQFLTFTTEYTPSSGSVIWTDGYTVTIQPNQKYIYNISVTYGKLPPNCGPSTNGTEGNETIEELSLQPDTITSWTKGWLPLTIDLNGTKGAECLENATLEDSDGAIKWVSDTFHNAAPGSGITIYPDITKECTIRVHLKNVGSVDAIVTLKWVTDYHFYHIPLFNYGIAGLDLTFLYSSVLLLWVFLTWRHNSETRSLSNDQDIGMSTVNCPRCGKAVPSGMTFCSSCGAKLDQALQQVNTHSYGWVIMSFLVSFLWFRIDSMPIFPLGFVGGLVITFFSSDTDRALGKKPLTWLSVVISIFGMFLGFLIR